MNRRTKLVAAVAGALVVVLVGGFLVYRGFIHQETYKITARFAATPGLYSGNTVDVLGVQKGTVESLTPKPHYVEVVLTLPTDVKVPADAKAVLMAPNPVSDRFVELTPPYTGGPTMADGAVIDLTDTVVPLELDSIYASLDNLSTALGPEGANAHGELSGLLHSLAGLANGNGKYLHQVIDRVAAALPALTAHPEDLANLVRGLDQLTGRLASHDDAINTLYGDLASATGQLADERATISAAISNLQRALAEVVTFLRRNRGHIGSSVHNLDTTIAAVLAEQHALIQTFDTAPLGFQNFNRAIDPNAPCLSADGAPNNCAALWGRIDTTSGASDLIKAYCGKVSDSLAPIILWNLGLANATATETACGAEVGLLQGRSGPPGAPQQPDLDLTHYLGSR
ncbi:MAG: phospholipid/cholesterol/gamma-HCH transport system substrate-binding protein [Pseudonocardiales bacterium]|nr:phospholipid/cholesterol/gamma-HCH transport system substrate-binding protein [Pseudonocardiales bacterium]